MRSHAAGEQRVAIGRRCGDARASERAARAADVLDDQLLAERCSHLLGHDARDHVARASGGERHHHGDRSCRKIVLLAQTMS